MRKVLASLSFAIIALFGGEASGGISGPVEATVVEVVDGDTIRVFARPWYGIFVETSVRIAGVDAPETNGMCPEERVKAAEAKRYLLRLLPRDTSVHLYDISRDKFGGRVVAKVTLGGVDLGEDLIMRELAKPYDGKKKQSWCPVTEQSPARSP